MKVSEEVLKELISASRSVAQFAEFGQGTSDEWISKAEAALGFDLPPSYRWWLSNYGGGEVLGDEIYSIYEEDFEHVVGGDVVAMHRLNSASGLLQVHDVAICDSDIDGMFYLDFSKRASDGEVPVMSQAQGGIYAADFSEFLLRRIQLAAGD